LISSTLQRGWRLPPPPRALTWLLLTLILLAALFLRVHELSNIPPGPFYDEAAATLLARQIAGGHSFPIFFQAYTGHEVLYYYLAAPLMRLVGNTVWTLRLVSALIGTTTVLLAYMLARELFHDDPFIESHWLGLFAAALMAATFWHVSVSRYGYRAITLPLVQSLMLLALWRGLRRDSPRWTITAGVFCGLIAYTYLASRIVPVALAILFSMILAAERRDWRKRAVQLGVFALVAFTVFAPLGIFFVTHPSAFFERTAQVSIFAPGSAWRKTLIRNTLRALQVFTLRGDPQIQFNLSERPLFQGTLALTFYAGLVVVVLRLARNGGFLARVRYALLTIWPLVMLMPSILSSPHQLPHSLRALGIMPLIFYIPALALVIALGIVQRVCRRRNTHIMTILAASTCIALLSGMAVSTCHDYFLRWAALPRLYYENNGDIADVARCLDTLSDNEQTTYVSLVNWYHPTVAALAHNYTQIKWIQGSDLLVFPPGPAVYAWPHDSLPEDEWTTQFLSDARPIAQGRGPDGSLAYMIYARDHPPVISPTWPLSATFGGAIQVIGYDTPRDQPSGEKGDVTIYWRILRRPEPSDYTEFITLRDAWGITWGQVRSSIYPPAEWTPGEIIAERIRVQTDDGAPPGNYMLELNWWSASTEQRLPVIDAQERYAGTTVTIGPITVTRRIRPLKASSVDMAHRLDVDFGGLKLLGFDQWPDTARQGESVFVTLYWEARTAPLPDRQVTLQLRRDQQVIVLAQGGLVHGTYPTSQWMAGEFVAERLALRIPPETPAGIYTLEAQVDDWPPQSLGALEVQAITRRWTPPAISHPMTITLGAQIALAGYTLEPLTPRIGQPITLTLVWKSLAPAKADYTVFTHLLEKDGIVRSQQDNAPLNNTYPTTLWLPGEFIVDVYTIRIPPNLPPGEYTLEAGMYLTETGTRLPVDGNGDSITLEKINLAP